MNIINPELYNEIHKDPSNIYLKKEKMKKYKNQNDSDQRFRIVIKGLVFKIAMEKQA